MKYTFIVLFFLLFDVHVEAQIKGDTTMLTSWREIDAKHVYTYFEDKKHYTWITGRDRSGVSPGYPDSGEAVRFNPRDSFPTFNDIRFLIEQNKKLSDRLDMAERRLDSLEQHPYLYIDNKATSGPQLIAKCPDGSCEIIIRELGH